MSFKIKITRKEARKLMGDLLLNLGLKVEFPELTLEITGEGIHVLPNMILDGEVR